jgi:AcrR family transcriptional regulator
MITSKAQPRRAEILEVATALFSERGFHGTRMDDIAQAARLNKATVYHYYDTKATILFELCMNTTTAILTQIKDLDSSPSAAEALDRYTRRLFNLIADRPQQALVHFQESPFLNEWLCAEQVEQVRALEHELESQLRRIMERGVKDGTFEDFDPRFMALSYSWLTNWFCRWYHPSGDVTPDEIADLFVTMFLGGLLAKTPR